MKLFKFKIKTTWIAAWLSVFTMVMSPVAMGQEAKNISKQQVQSALDQLGLNKTMTVGEFFQKNKSLFPERILKEIEPIFANYKNVLMPEFQVTTVTGPDGREIPNLSLSQNGQLFNIQWFGEKEKYVKFQNTNLSEIDIINFTDMFSRVLNGDAVLRKQNEANQTGTPTKPAKFSGLPVLDAATWKSMTPMQRATYVIQVRLLWEDAKRVLREQDKFKGKKSAAADINLNFLEKVWAFLDGMKAEAGTVNNAKKRNTNPVIKKTAVNGNYAGSCLVAGYIAYYSPGGVCDYKLIKDEYTGNDDIKKAQAGCPGKAACNPFIYGYTSEGTPICVSMKDESFQRATHAAGPCESGSSLKADEKEILNKRDLKSDRYDNGNLKDEKERRAMFKDDNAIQMSKEFLAGILKSKGKSISDLYEKGDGPLTTDGFDVLKKIQDQFNGEISDGIKACEAVVRSGKTTERNFVPACDQLHRRFLYIADIIGDKCETGSVINSDSLKCTCPVGSSVTEVIPGASCKGTTTSPTLTEDKDKSDTKDRKKDQEGRKTKAGEACGPNEREDSITGKDSGAVATKCVPITSTKTPPPAEDCGVLCKIGKGLKFILPVAVGIGAIYLMYKVFSPKKPKLNPPGDTCPSGATAPCTASCPYPLANVNGTCGCAACPPGQTLTSTATCSCGTTTTTSGNTLTCWDGTTKVSDLTLCPTQKYTCWDGSSVTNSLNCPEKPATNTTTTTPAGKTGR